MDCREAQSRIVEMISGEIGSEADWALRAHVLRCPGCADRIALLGEAWNVLGRWEDEPAPASLGARVARRVEQERRLARAAAPRAALPIALILGVLASVISVCLSVRHLDPGDLKLPALVVGGAVWAGLYMGAFVAFFQRLHAAGVDLGRLAGMALAGSLGSVLFFVYCPITDPENVCLMIPFMTPLYHVGGGYPAYFALGAISAVVPMLVLGAAAGDRIQASPVAAAITTGCILAVLLAPAFFLQMASFSVGIIAVALLGGFAGSFAGSFAGTLVGIRARVAVSHAR